jgi:ATP-binding cassette subfamily F protein uup
MALLTLLDAQLAYGDQPLLDRAAFSMESGERIGLIGRNGTGKSSLLSVIAGRASLDEGEARLREGARVVLVEQEPSLPHAGSLRAALLLHGHVPSIADERERWQAEARLTEYLHRFGLSEDLSPQVASGGEAKRAALALAFALQPDLLLLDEPTNHLDIGGIETLEGLLARIPAAIVVTHDRAFLDRVCTRILELDRGWLHSYAGNWSAYERVKADELAAEAVSARKFDTFWKEEEAWIRKGIQARRTRNEGRVRRLERLREARAARRERLGAVKLSLSTGRRSGKLVAELARVSKSFGDRAVVKGLGLLVSRGDRLGLVGPNGAGKTTLLKLILGTLPPDSGTVRIGTKVVPAYFDQMREALDPAKTVAETVSPGSDWVELEGGRKHVMTYLGDFLFPPRRAASPVRMLSGGERNRLLLARLFARPANVLVLDEPTNDLDIESLELLEAALQDYSGTLLLVSHDRAFLDNVVTSVLAPEGDGKWKEYAGGYADWLRQRPAAAVEEKPAAKAPAREKARVKLSYKEQRALEALPGEIEALEAEQKALEEHMRAPDYFKRSAEELKQDHRRAEEIEARLMEKLERWEALEAKAKGAA